MELSVRSIGRTAVVVAVYFASAMAAVMTTRFGGGVACVWIATAVLGAALVTSPRRDWVMLCVGCGLAGVVATASFGLGLRAALPLGLLNVVEAVTGAVLLRWLERRHQAGDPVGRLAILVFATAVVAPVIGATVGAAVAAWVGSGGYWINWVRWYAGHSLGTLTFMPVFAMFLSGNVRRTVSRASRRQIAESAALLMLVVLTTLAVFLQKTLPLLFVPILPVILATFRLGRLGAALSIVCVAGIGGVLTLKGFGPVNLVGGDIVSRVHLFQFYLAATVMTALPVAADLARRDRLYARLRDSEARYRLLTDNSTDIVMSLHVDGTVRYASPSITQLGGYAPDDVIGRNAIDLVLESDRLAVSAAHRAAVATPGVTQIVEFRARMADGSLRWFEAHSRGVADESGAAIGIVNAARDVSHRKQLEAELTSAALTDPLTGLANRRRFDLRLAEIHRAEQGGCLAIFDIDHFKAVNDRHGHQAGDDVLRTFATIARGCVRDGDLIARLGGEEFGIVLPGASVDQARLVCERLRATIADTAFALGEKRTRITVSAGIASLVGDSDAVLKAADAALYQAKRAGRNRLRLAA
ncbi:diguanylate cyclase [Sphingomonas ginsenosidivorax]|uniref:diguanylate cyclase n=1 Tax=Sphingomonas ginsenosidivorax TaxID=862135 RepID=A0A5C6UBY6_9SPHN|nr:diguanylate cyclase [Sphingomonas ginsenosidivorax]TXC69535.1 diguanylate cyclase [Sphingomonas ginsenosidivorax]TXC72650.1 diguanylate cyclase [Sphingomonas ginsenosidivorax]